MNQCHFSEVSCSICQKVWWYFVVAKMLPCLHISYVIKDRVVLLYAIVIGRSINISHVINHVMLLIASTKRDGLWFPSLITSLCGRVGIQWHLGEELLHSKVSIDMGLIY
ncbi:Uncharacterized protein TCM_040417 [Theobroma cacao]|uniref:Putative plant transposon protein domain-containing protein n=1 Tax=Theobroma cacao TaxID=3641 RepID=A0A061GZ27_THECC|nr:Uncharacterized protein TCM_040417 [Theobroma cacao]